MIKKTTIDTIDFTTKKQSNLRLKEVLREIALFWKFSHILEDEMDFDSEEINSRIKTYNYFNTSGSGNESGNEVSAEILTFDNKPCLMLNNIGYNDLEYDIYIIDGADEVYNEFVDFITNLMLDCFKEIVTKFKEQSPLSTDDNMLQTTISFTDTDILTTEHKNNLMLNDEDVTFVEVVDDKRIAIEHDGETKIVELKELEIKTQFYERK